MSWSLTKNATRADARAVFAKAHQDNHAYQTDGSHRAVMDKIAAFAADIAELAPPGTDAQLNSSGHVAQDGTGSIAVSLGFYRPATA